MKTYEMFVEATEADLKAMGASPSQIAMLKKRQEKRGKGFSTGDDRVKSTAADKGTDIVRQKRGGTGKEAVGVPRKSGPGVGSFDKPGSMSKRGSSSIVPVSNKGGALTKHVHKKGIDDKQIGQRPGTSRSNAKNKPAAIPDGGPGRALRDKLAKKDNIAKGKAFRDVKRGATNAFKDAAMMTSKSGPGVAQSTDLKGAPRGIYNPK